MRAENNALASDRCMFSSVRMLNNLFGLILTLVVAVARE